LSRNPLLIMKVFSFDMLSKDSVIYELPLTFRKLAQLPFALVNLSS
jgi:hypothetical protein